MEELPAASSLQKKEGYLFKRGLVNKGWKKRWMKIEGVKILYYRQPNGQLRGTIRLTDCYDLQSTSPTSISITTEYRMWELKAKTPEDMVLLA